MTASKTDLTTGSISKTLFKLSLPIILTNLMHVFYNLTDTFWVGKLEDGACNAVAVTNNVFPLVWFISSISGGVGTAATVLISHYTGNNNLDGVKKVSGQITIFVTVFSICFVVLGVLGGETLINWLGTPDEIKASAVSYLKVIMTSMIFMLWFGFFQSISHARGNSIIPMKIQFSAVLLNVVLDPFLIFGWWGVPEYGVMGAAYATFFSRMLSVTLAFTFMFRHYRDVLPNLTDFRPDFTVLKKIIQIAIPSSMSQSTTSFGFLVLQNFVNHYGTVVCTVYALNNRFVGVFLIPAMGINNAMISIIGQNLGAGKVDRAEKTVWIALKIVLIMMGIGALFLFHFGGELTRIFINDDQVVEMASHMFRIVSISALICSAMFIFTSTMDGAGHTRLSMTVSIIRLWLFRIPFSYLLSGFFIYFYGIKNGTLYDFLNLFRLFPRESSYDGLWWGMLISNTIGLIWSYLLFRSGRWKIPVIELKSPLKES